MTKEPRISNLQIGALSVAVAIVAANIYYNQPILNDIAKDLNVSEKSVGYLPILTQIGYGVGLFFITPLGDKMNRKRLILTLQSLLIVALLGLTFSRNIHVVYAFNFIIGVFSVATQVILPTAASLAPKNKKGKIIGIVFTGLLIGILGARIVSGFIAHWLGWQYVYSISSVLLLISSLMIYFILPDMSPIYKGHYISLLQSTIKQIGRFRSLRIMTATGCLFFGVFSSFWTTITFHLGNEPFSYNSDKIGMLGFIGIGGALIAPLVGKITDKRHPARIQPFTILLLILGVLVAFVFPLSISAFIISTLIIDIGVQASQLNNLAQVYKLDEEASSRINTMYMTCIFIGGAIGTFAGVYSWDAGGWAGCCLQMLLWSTTAFVLAIIGAFLEKK